jgi:cytidine deaminase
MTIKMIKKEINIKYSEYSDVNELSEDIKVLIDEAKESVSRAYAKYSGFYVGSAIKLDNGEVITGNNQENAAYPSGLCAERVAIFYANSKYPDVAVNAMVICAKTNGQFVKTPAAPCGACRQVMIETELRFEKDIKVVLYGKEKIIIFESVKDLLPLYFNNL